MLKEEKRSLKDKLEKVYEFMKQFVIGGMNLLEKFWNGLGRKLRMLGEEGDGKLCSMLRNFYGETMVYMLKYSGV